MTYALLLRGLRFYESNPIARWWLIRWNMAGMTAFKFLVVGGVIVLSEIIKRQRPGLGRAVLWLGSLVAGIVVIYSFGLLLKHANVPLF